uniref:HDC13289 n=1 Tax=Drosophila melanogaster TaxID=7227 RepID=Q6IK68_DROME|nr:TPA_inf: HDC13289 [Drosophila melanogaster]
MAMAMASSFPVKRGPGLFCKFDGRICRRDEEHGQLTDRQTNGQRKADTGRNSLATFPLALSGTKTNNG